MTYAYDIKYLDDAMKNLGEAFDYAANDCGISMDYFADMFTSSGIARQFGLGVPKYVAGMSGVELVWEVIGSLNSDVGLPEPKMVYDLSPEYWCGWILAYYQWKTGKNFEEIKYHISMTEILKLYPTLHEASEEKFVYAVNRMIEAVNRHDNYG